MRPCNVPRALTRDFARGTVLATVGFGGCQAMASNPITGHSLRFKFADGPVAGKSFDHTFSRNGHVTFKEVGSDPEARPGVAQQYEVASVNSDVHTVSYLSSSGYTLT